MTKYVCGFAFAEDQVLLIEKKRPAWQLGRLNGVGGHVEPGESAYQAMCREFREETGLATHPAGEYDWVHFASLKGADFCVYFFYVEGDWQYLRAARATTEERLVWCNPASVTIHNAVPNLTWLLPLARNLRHEVSPRKAVRITLVEEYR